MTLGGATANESTAATTAAMTAAATGATSGAARRAALEQIATEVRTCTRCRLSETRTHAVPGEGNPDTEVMFVGEGPGQNEDREGRPFVGRAGELLVKLIATLGWRRQEVFITNIVKCRPPGNRDPEPDEIAACTPYLQRQLEVLDPAIVVTLGRFSMAHFRPGERITQIHGTHAPAPAATGARDALTYALFHPAAALRSPGVERQSYDDIAGLPRVLTAAREGRALARPQAGPTHPAPTSPGPHPALTHPALTQSTSDPTIPSTSDPGADAPTLF